MTIKHIQTHFRIFNPITSKYHNIPEQVVSDIVDKMKHQFDLEIDPEWIILTPTKYFKFNEETEYDTEWPIEISATAPTWFHNLMDGDVISNITAATINKLI